MNMPPIPDRLKHLPLHNGIFPIHFTVFVGPDGQPDFKVIHTENRTKAMQNDWCHICGQPLDPVVVFIGGDKCKTYRVFVDGPMHEECAIYSALACPYLNNPLHGHSKAPPKHSKSKGVKIKVHQAIESGRPARMGMFWSNSYSLIHVQGTGICFMSKPFIKEDWAIMPQRKTDES